MNLGFIGTGTIASSVITGIFKSKICLFRFQTPFAINLLVVIYLNLFISEQ